MGAERANKEQSDYLNEVDSLRYCGKCHAPKQMKIKMRIKVSRMGIGN